LHELRPEFQSLAVGRLCLRSHFLFKENIAQIAVAQGQVLTILGHVGEFLCQLRLELQDLAVGSFRLPPLTEIKQEIAQIVLAGS
jgi:hypothetical protein